MSESLVVELHLPKDWRNFACPPAFVAKLARKKG